LEISEYFAIPTIPRSSSFDDEKRIVGIVKIIKKKKNTLLLTPHASEKWIRRKTPFYINETSVGFSIWRPTHHGSSEKYSQSLSDKRLSDQRLSDQMSDKDLASNSLHRDW
jgi:hypothetical protein